MMNTDRPKNLYGIKAEPVNHKGKNRIKLIFEYDEELICKVKQIPGARWSETMKCWHIPDDEYNRTVFNITEKDRKSNYRPERFNKHDKCSHNHNLSIEKYQEWLKGQRYSSKTIVSYVDAIRVFCKFFSEKSLSEITNDDIADFNFRYILKNDFSISYQNQVVNSIKLFFRIIEKKQVVVEEIERPRRAKKLPDILSQDEIESILRHCSNVKHKSMLSLVYACGLRRSELLNLRIQSVDSKRNLLLIKEAKGMKDRVVPLPVKMIELLREYYKIYKPKQWLFEGFNVGEQYSETSLQQVFKRALKSAGIKKEATLHTLRHSYATHLLENGTDLRFIQEILGHKSSKTTEIYTHVTQKSIEKIKSPFENLKI